MKFSRAFFKEWNRNEEDRTKHSRKYGRKRRTKI